MIWANIKSFFLLYVRPSSAVGGLIDSGSWWLAMLVFVAVSYAFTATIKQKIIDTYGDGFALHMLVVSVGRGGVNQSQLRAQDQVDRHDENGRANPEPDEPRRSYQHYGRTPVTVAPTPPLGVAGRWLIWSMTQTWLAGMLAICVLYVPATIFALSLLAPIGSFSLALRRDFGTVLTCGLMAWSATHLPFVLAGAILSTRAMNPAWFFASWLTSTIWFGVLMVTILRVVYGCSYGSAAVAVLTSWPSVTLGARAFGYLTPLLFSPFILIYLWMIARGEVGSLSASYRQRQSFRRYLASSTINPRDADAHFQLGLIHQQRRQENEALACFQRAIEIDPTEIDARYQLGVIARKRGQLAEAIEHFGIVVTENEWYAQGEVWREIGTTYLKAGMLEEARESLEKYVDRRSFDPEGLYYLGETLNKLGRPNEAKEMLGRCLDSVQTMPHFRRAEVRRWSKMAREQLATLAD